MIPYEINYLKYNDFFKVKAILESCVTRNQYNIAYRVYCRFMAKYCFDKFLTTEMKITHYRMDHVLSDMTGGNY
jgi:hypothetical protein